MKQAGKPGFALILHDWHKRVPCSREKHIRKECFMQTCKVENKCIIQMNMCTYWMTLCLTRFLFCSACKQFVGDKENLQIIPSSGNEGVRSNTFRCLSYSVQLIISQIFTFCLTYIVIIQMQLAPF